MLWRHSALYLLARGVPGLISLLAIAVYTRLLTTDEYGRYALVIAGVGFANKAVFEWLRLALLRFMPAFKHRREAFDATIAAGFLALVCGTAVLGCLALLLNDDPRIGQLLLVGISLLWIQALFDLQLEHARSQLRPGQYGMLAFLRAGLSLALGATFVAIGGGALGALLGLCLGMVVALAQPAVQTWRRIRLRLVDRQLIWRLCQYGAPLSVTATLGFIIAASDRFLIGWMLGDDQVGRYAVGYDLSNLSLGLLLMIVNLAAYPLVIRALEEHGAEAARHQLTGNLTALAGVGLPAAIGVMILAEPIADVMIGAQFRSAAIALMPLIALATVLRELRAYYFDLAFHLSRRPFAQLWVTITAAAANLVLNLLLIPAFGIMGAAYATIAAYAIALVLSWLLGRRLFKLPAPGLDVLKIAIAASGMAILIWPFREWSGILPLVGQMLAGAGVYGLFLVVLDVAGMRTIFLAGLGRVGLNLLSK